MNHRLVLMSIAILCGAVGIAAFLPRSVPPDPVRASLLGPVPRPVAVSRAGAPSRPRPETSAPLVLPDPAAIDVDEAVRTASWDDRIRSERTDTEWRSEVSARLELALGDMPGIAYDPPQCGATLCRIEVDLADEEARDQFTRRLGRLPGPGGEGLVHAETDDDPQVVVYLTRDGEHLVNIPL